MSCLLVLAHSFVDFGTDLLEKLHLSLLRILLGLENRSLLRPSTAVEYDFCLLINVLGLL